MGIFTDVVEAAKGAGSIAGAVTAVATVIGQGLGLVARKQDRDQGAIAQRELDKDDTLKALADDRVRDSNDALDKRVRDDHGIEPKP